MRDFSVEFPSPFEYSLIPISYDFSLKDIANYGYTNISINQSSQTITILKDGYQNEVIGPNKNCEIRFKEPSLATFTAKKDEYFTLEFKVEVSPEDALIFEDIIRNKPIPLPQFLISFLGNTIDIHDTCYVHKPGITTFRFADKAKADFTGIRLFIKPIAYNSIGPSKDVSLRFFDFRICKP